MHYYNFHIGDYKAHTHHLSIIEDLAYRRLLDLYYMTEKPIIGDQAARLIGMREHGHEVLCVLMEFFEETENGFISKRADAEISSFRAMSEGGRKGANKRWHSNPNREVIATPCPPHSLPTDTLMPTNNQEPITNNQYKNIPPEGGDDLKKDLFDSAKAIGIKPSLVGKAINEIGEIEAMAALEQCAGQESPTNAFAASVRNRKERIRVAGESAEILRPRLNDPRVLSI